MTSEKGNVMSGQVTQTPQWVKTNACTGCMYTEAEGNVSTLPNTGMRSDEEVSLLVTHATQ